MKYKLKGKMFWAALSFKRAGGWLPYFLRQLQDGIPITLLVKWENIYYSVTGDVGFDKPHV
jgi:hypothetical protein